MKGLVSGACGFYFHIWTQKVWTFICVLFSSGFTVLAACWQEVEQ